MNCNYFGSQSIWEKLKCDISMYTHVSARIPHSVLSSLSNSLFFGFQLCHLYKMVPQQFAKWSLWDPRRNLSQWVEIIRTAPKCSFCSGMGAVSSCRISAAAWGVGASLETHPKEKSPAGLFFLFSLNTIEKFSFVSFLVGLECCFSQWALRNSPNLKFSWNLCPAVKTQFLFRV